MRTRPTAIWGLVAWFVYGVIVVVIQKTSGISYTDFGDTPGNMWRAPILSLLVGGVFLVALSLWLGWWRVAWRDEQRVVVHWTLLAPAIYVLVVMATLAGTVWGNVTSGFLLTAVVLGIGVGFAEEFQCRGLLLVGLRGSMGEVGVWALTCLLFGVMHAAGIFLGEPASSTAVQVISAAAQGSGFYILRRYFGSLVWAMAMHGLWDAAIFVNANSDAEPTLFTALVWVALPLSLIGGFVLARRTQQAAAEEYAVVAAA